MSELKAFRIIQGDTGGYGAPSYKCDRDGTRIEEWSDVCEVYDRFEADKVIAEKDKEIARQNVEIKEAVKTMKSLETEIIELKSEADRYIAELQSANQLEIDEWYNKLMHQKYKRCVAMARACMEMQCETEQQADFAVRWEHRWLTLATYYKEMAK